MGHEEVSYEEEGLAAKLGTRTEFRCGGSVVHLLFEIVVRASRQLRASLLCTRRPTNFCEEMDPGIDLTWNRH